MSIIDTVNDAWGWSGIEAEELVGENDFGNLMLKDVNGRYWRLSPEDVYCKVVAENKSELDALSVNQEFLSDWYMKTLTDLAIERFGKPESGRKFHLTIPGILGGEYGIENIQVVDQLEQIRFSGDIGRQIMNLPEGSEIQLKIID